MRPDARERDAMTVASAAMTWLMRGYSQCVAERRLEIDRLTSANNATIGAHRIVRGHVAGWPRRGRRG